MSGIGRRIGVISVLVVALVALSACGDGDGGGHKPLPPLSQNAHVTLSWDQSKAAGVNRAGGGYKVYYSTASGFDIKDAKTVEVPYVSGSAAPTTATLTLASGTYYVRVAGFSTINPHGGTLSGEAKVTVPFAN